MTIEARYMNFASQFDTNRECVKSQLNMNYNGQVENVDGYPVTFGDWQSPYMQYCDINPVQIAPSFDKFESDFIYNFCQAPAPRAISKRKYDSDNIIVAKKGKLVDSESLIKAEFVPQMHQQQSEMEQIITHQIETLRVEFEARQRAQMQRIVSVAQTIIKKKLQAKDDEIVRMEKLNWLLQERVNNLCVENQFWRDLAQTTEATSNNLRSNLEQVLTQLENFPSNGKAFPLLIEDDAESSCGSCDGADDVKAVTGICRRCGERRASILVLPCRHLSLCTVCGSALTQSCPVCDTVMNASVHVNF